MSEKFKGEITTTVPNFLKLQHILTTNSVFSLKFFIFAIKFKFLKPK